MGRYELRALTRRKFAIRDFNNARRCLSGQCPYPKKESSLIDRNIVRKRSCVFWQNEANSPSEQ